MSSAHRVSRRIVIDSKFSSWNNKLTIIPFGLAGLEFYVLPSADPNWYIKDKDRADVYHIRICLHLEIKKTSDSCLIQL